MNKNTILNTVAKMIDLKKAECVSSDMETLEKRLEALKTASSSFKSEYDSKQLKKITTRVKWLSDEIELIKADNNEQDEQSEQIALDVVEDVEKVASVKPPRKVKKVEKENKTKAQTKEKKAQENVKTLEAKDIPAIQPIRKIYVTLETNETLRVIYKDEKTVVLQDSEGVIECASDKFEKGLVYYSIANKQYLFSIISVEEK